MSTIACCNICSSHVRTYAQNDHCGLVGHVCAESRLASRALDQTATLHACMPVRRRATALVLVNKLVNPVTEVFREVCFTAGNDRIEA